MKPVVFVIVSGTGNREWGIGFMVFIILFQNSSSECGRGLSPVKKESGLEELPKNANPDMQHDEIDWGESVGNEQW